MCGIIGYYGNKDACNVVVDGLKRLEYRGYDSFGISFLGKNNIEVVKGVGKIGGFQNIDKESNVAIGHTRWATHGSVTESNAHPHLSNNNEIAVVHNGIVENYQELKESLESAGFKFRSDCDSEVIPNLIQFYMQHEKMDLIEATVAALERIEGSYAVVIMHKDLNGLIGARDGSPLVVGIGKGEYFFASDIPALLQNTKKVIYMDDKEMAIAGKFVKVFDLKKHKEVKKDITEIDWSLEQAQKGSYEHFMLKEIDDQKFTIKKAIEQRPELIEKVTRMIKGAKGVFFVGCGTSYHACVSASYIFTNVARMHVNVALASEFRNYEDFLTPKTLVIAVSQSGETADLLDAVKTAKRRNSKIISIVNVMGSTLTRLSDETIMMNAGPEICVLSTKSYTSQLAILLLLAYVVAGREREAKELINKTTGLIPNIIEKNLRDLKTFAPKFKEAKDIFLIGRGLAYPTAMEGALKIKEVSYIHAEAFAGGELKHGTIALIEKGTPTVVVSTDATRKLIMSNANEIKSRGGFIIGIDSLPNELFDYFIQVEDVGNANPILKIIPIQILAYYLALSKGCDVDHPRNLAKSCTVH